MSGIQLKTNIASLNAQRLLGESTARLQTSFERLSSGLRINRASDDAAGLAIAASLNADKRVFSQGVRNANDALSLLNVAEGTVTEFSSIVTRLKELAEQSANGTLTRTQRLSLHQEGIALVDEYNRLTKTANFNGLKLLDGSLTELVIQAGYGTDGQISLALGNKLSRTVGDGTFQEGVSMTAGNSVGFLQAADLNGDGAPDIITGSAGDAAISVFLNNGDGTFAARTTIATSANPFSVLAVDVNNDGHTDLASANFLANEIQVFLGDGAGNFGSAIASNTGAFPADLISADFNDDEILDLATYAENDGNINVLLGNGDATFQSPIALPASTFTIPQLAYVRVGDITGNGTIDIVGLSVDSGKRHVYSGNGDGTFSLSQVITPITSSFAIELADLNADNILDLVANETGAFSVSLGKADGTFGARQVFGNSGGVMMKVIDLNGDGKPDVISTSENEIQVGIGNGDGTLTVQTQALTTEGGGVAVADLNGDGVLDLVVSDIIDGGNSIRGHFGNAAKATTLQYFNLTRQDTALQALDDLTESLQHISGELADIGSFQSRIGSAVRTLQQRVENFSAAQSQIEDVDVAEEAARLTQERIRQQIATSVLAQANAIPSLVLTLLQQ